MATCTLTGTFTDPQGTAVANASVTFTTESPFVDADSNLILPKEVSTTTDTNGDWSLTIIQNVTGSLSLDLAPRDNAPTIRYNFSVVIPASASATFADCWVDSPLFSAVLDTNPTFADISGNLALGQLPSLASASAWVGDADGAAAPVAISGDATLSNTGAVAVTAVGGSSAANVHAAELLANAATASNTASAIVKRDASGNIAVGTVTGNLTGNVTGNLTGTASAATLAATVTTNANLTGAIVSTGNATTYNGMMPTNLGGTNLSSYASGDLIYASAVNVLSTLNKGSDGMGLKLASGIPAWGYQAVTSQSTTYLATLSDSIILVSGSGGGWTLTLPAASTATGKTYYIKRTDNTPANAVTIDGNASETIDGATTYALYTQYESVVIVCDGSNWHVVDHKCNTAWEAYGTTGSFTGYGTVSNISLFWCRNGNNLNILGRFTSGTSTNVEARIAFPNSEVADATVIATLRVAGYYYRNQTNAASYPVLIESGVGYMTVGQQDATKAGLTKILGNAFVNASDTITILATIPIANWKP